MNIQHGHVFHIYLLRIVYFPCQFYYYYFNTRTSPTYPRFNLLKNLSLYLVSLGKDSSSCFCCREVGKVLLIILMQLDALVRVYTCNQDTFFCCEGISTSYVLFFIDFSPTRRNWTLRAQPVPMLLYLWNFVHLQRRHWITRSQSLASICLAGNDSTNRFFLHVNTQKEFCSVIFIL
jgi:hypothetical protein